MILLLIGTVLAAAPDDDAGVVDYDPLPTVRYPGPPKSLWIGVTPPMSSWGTMIAESLAAMRTYPLLLVFPGAALSLTLLSFTYVGDALRDALDPLMKR